MSQSDQKKIFTNLDSDAQKARSRGAFEDVLNLHRTKASVREVYFLKRLCFPLEDTKDPMGLRYVLWGPLARLRDL